MRLTKRAIIISLILMFVVGLIPSYAGEEIKIMINNKLLFTDTPPVIVDGRTLVPLRAIGEAMGCEVIWVAATNTANLRNETTIVSMQIGNTNVTRVKRVTPDAKTLIQIDVPPMLINDRTYIPARALAESLGAVVGWDGSTNSVIIVYDMTLNYAGNMTVATYAGTGERKKHDSETDKMAFISPESIDVADDGSIYIADSGLIRKISDGKSETIEFEPSYITVSALKCYKNDVYALTHEFENADNVKYYGIVKLTGKNADGVFVTEATYSKISDFDISKDGKIYVVQNNLGVGKNYIGELDLNNGDISIISEVDEGIKALTVDKNGNLFLANTVKGSLYFFDMKTKTIKLFAGVDDKTKFVDGPNPMFFEPRRLDYADGYLYVLDYNVIRRVAINDANLAIYAETIAGKITVEQNPDTIDGKASEITLAPSYLMDFVVTNGGVLFTDPKKAVIRVIK